MKLAAATHDTWGTARGRSHFAHHHRPFSSAVASCLSAFPYTPSCRLPLHSVSLGVHAVVRRLLPLCGTDYLCIPLTPVSFDYSFTLWNHSAHCTTSKAPVPPPQTVSAGRTSAWHRDPLGHFTFPFSTRTSVAIGIFRLSNKHHLLTFSLCFLVSAGDSYLFFHFAYPFTVVWPVGDINFPGVSRLLLCWKSTLKFTY